MVGVAAVSASETGVTGVVERTAEVRVAQGRGAFERLTRVLDARAAGSLNEEVSDSGDDASDSAQSTRPVLFFSENVASLLDVANRSRSRTVAG